MSLHDLIGMLERAVGDTHPDVVRLAVRADPLLLLWPALFALGAWLLLSELQDGRARPSLIEQFARQDVDRRLRETLESELAQTLGVTPEPERAHAGSERNLFPPVLKRMLRPVLTDTGWLVRALLVRLAPGLAGGASLERDLRLVRPAASLGGYFAEKVGAMLLWLAIAPCLAALGGPHTSPIVWLVAGIVGFVLPDIDLRRRLGARRLRLVAELPAVLDQVVIATSAGLSLEQALEQTAGSSDGTVADELSRMVTELSLGRWRSLQDALEGLDRRNGVPELSSLVGQLRAAHRQGVPVGQVLAAQADALRERRRAEIVEAGGQATVRMVIPIALFVLPVLAIVTLVPAGVQLLQLRG
jgi:Type II secretion system (T2SS), protein F